MKSLNQEIQILRYWKSSINRVGAVSATACAGVKRAYGTVVVIWRPFRFIDHTNYTSSLRQCLLTKRVPSGLGEIVLIQRLASSLLTASTSEPCIRGHRSSKCQHFDRLMMKVPKAGRPLAKCPHPKGTCSCQKTYAFMVRIPKGNNKPLLGWQRT